jgi:glycine cleavage system H protein
MDLSKFRYTSSHEWALQDGPVVTVGITQYAVDQLTDVTHLQLPKAGTAVTAVKPFGEIESVKAVFDLNSPVTGTVQSVNAAVEKDPSLINGDPYGAGWLLKVELGSGSTLDHLMTLEQYEKQLADH